MRLAMLLLWITGAMLLPVALAGQENAAVSEGKDLVRVDSPVSALEHVRVIDGAGAPAKPDQTIVISEGKIAAIGDSDSIRVPENAKRLDFTGYTALPGLVGMHDHLFYVTTEVNDNYVATTCPSASLASSWQMASRPFGPPVPMNLTLILRSRGPSIAEK